MSDVAYDREPTDLLAEFEKRRSGMSGSFARFMANWSEAREAYDAEVANRLLPVVTRQPD